MTANVTNLPVAQTDPSEIMEAVLLAGDLSKLSHGERTRYLMQTCQSLGLNPLTKPFDYIRLSGREVLYATKGCADQLRSNRRISLEVTNRTVTGDLMTVTVRATTPDGRFDEDMAAVSVKGLAGEALSNAMMKVVTKAKRRVTLSICGLGMLDETEVRSVLEAEALAVSSELRLKITPPRIEPVPEKPKTSTPPTFSVVVPYGGEPAVYPRTRGGAKEALAEIVGIFNEGHHDVVALNLEALDDIAKVPTLADEVSELRASAAEALRPKDEDETQDSFVTRFVAGGEIEQDDFPGDISATSGSGLPSPAP
jgi:hypothetical protein